MWGFLFDEKSGLYFSVFAGHRQSSLSQMSPTGLMSIVYCHYFWDSPNQEGQVPVFISHSSLSSYPTGNNIFPFSDN
jgi:hypothetical protein